MEKVRMRPSPIPAVTCYNFVAENTDEISFKRGSKVFVKNKNTGDKDYYLIEVDGKEGLAPVSFLQAEGGEAPPTVKQNELGQTWTKLGGGTFSDVYEVTWKQKKYALKNYHKQEDFSKALEEAKLINSLDHKNIVKVYGICEKPVALLLELCEGKHLADLWKDDNNESFNPPLRIILLWAKQIAEGLWYMHNRDLPVCHADIKPQNCMLKEIPCIPHYTTEDSDKCSQCGLQRLSRLSIKLTDFGLSKVSENRASTANPGKDDCPFGSIPYMSPESIKSNRITPKSDVWSFGVLLWELLTKQVPYHELEYVNGIKLSPMAIMFAIGKREVHLEILDSWPIALQNLLQACWEDNEEIRPTMGDILQLIEKIPTTNPDYVMVGAPKKPTNLSNIEKIKNILNSNLFHNYFASDKPKAPPRNKIKKLDIGEPTNLTNILSVRLVNGEVEVHDHESNRRRNISSNDNNNSGTLPRHQNLIKNRLGPSAISTPELNQIGLSSSSSASGSGLERKAAMRKKGGIRGQSDHSSMTSCKPVILGSTTPSSEASISFDNTVEVVEDPAQIRAPRPSRDSQNSYKSSPRRSPSSHSQSIFYVHDLTPPCGESPCPYDNNGTLTSRGSTDSATSSKKSKNIFRKYLPNPFSRKHETYPSNVCYNSETGEYFDLKEKPNRPFDSIDEDGIESLKLSPHLQTITLFVHSKQQTNETPTTSHFVKQLNTPKKQRQQAVVDHRRNVSNTSEKLSWNTFTNNNNNNNNNTSVTPTTTNPPKSPASSHHHHLHQHYPSSSDSISLSTTAYSPSRTSMSFGTVVPLPTTSPIISQTTFPSNSDEPFAGFNDHRSRALTNAAPTIPENPPPILHPRSKSTDQNSMLNNLIQGFGMNGHEQIIVENNAYFKLNPNSKSGSNISPTAATSEVPHYMTLRKQRSDDHEAPPLPPRSSVSNFNSSNNLLNTVVEIPKSQAPTLSPRLHHSQSASPNPSASSSSGGGTSDYLTLENSRNSSNSNTYSTISSSNPSSAATVFTNPHYIHTKSSPGRLDDEIPRSIAPQRPDTLELEEQPRQRIERNNGYVQLSGQVNDNDDNNRTPKFLPNNIPHRNRRH
jgi:tRNA A-37 threonylcarbamoyl transferase component Bud32